MTLTDLSEAMIAQSRTLNPDLEHVQGDMRTLRLGRTFDAVFLDADKVSYRGIRVGDLYDDKWFRERLNINLDEKNKILTHVHGEASFGVDADEDTSSGDLRRFVKHRPVFECSQGRLDFAETLIDLVGQLVGIPVVDFQLGLLGVQRIDGGLLLRREIDGLAFDLS